MSDSDLDAAMAVLGQVIDIGQTPQQMDLGLAVAQELATRPPRIVTAPDPQVLKTLRAPQVGEELCRAWGLNPNRVSHIQIDIPAHGLPTVIVTMYAEDDLTEALTKCYRLLPEDAT